MNVPPTPPPLKTAGETAGAQAPNAANHETGITDPQSQYTQTQYKSSPMPVIETDFDLETRATESDPTFRAPTMLRKTNENTSASENNGVRCSASALMWSERSTAAFLGFAAGMLIIVPAVFYLSLETSQQPGAAPPSRSSLATQENARARGQTVKFMAAGTASIADGRWINQTAPDTLPGQPTALATADGSAVQDDIRAAEQKAAAIAKRLIADGQLSDARATLRQAASPDTAKLWFLLAETYDPNITPSAPGTKNVLTLTDTKFARFYYTQALTHGIAEAQPRLNTLAAPRN